MVQFNLAGPFDIHKDDHSLRLEGWLRGDEDLRFDYTQIDLFPAWLKPLNRLRYKGWDYYFVVTKDLIVSVNISDILGIGGSLFSVYNTKTKKLEITASEESFDFKLAPNAPSTLVTGEFHSSKLQVSFDQRDVKFSYKDGEQTFDGQFHIHYEQPKHEAITTIMPISEDEKHFFFATKKPGLGI